jgi:hypothetical protein
LVTTKEEDIYIYIFSTLNSPSQSDDGRKRIVIDEGAPLVSLLGWTVLATVIIIFAGFMYYRHRRARAAAVYTDLERDGI